MSNDVATLGLAIDSRQVVAAKKALDDLTASSKPAAAAAAAVEKSTAAAGKGAAAMASGTGLARHEMINLSRQLQDVGVSLASGQSPFMVMAQQGTQIADIFGSSKSGTVGGALKQIVSYIGPMRLLGLGIAGLAAGGYMASSALQGSLKALDDVSRSAGTTIGQFQALQTAANFKGIGSDDFQKSMGKFADDVYRAQSGMGGLAEVFRANNVQAKTFDDYLLKAADLIKNASTDQQRLQLLQQMGLPATMEWVRFLSQGSESIKAATKAAGDFNEGAAGKMIARAREFDDAWNRATTNAGNKMKSWLLGLDEMTFSAIDKFKQIAQNTYGNGAPPTRVMVTGGSNAPKPVPTVDRAVLQHQISIEQQALGIYGQTTTALEAQRQVELQVQAARLNGVAVDEKRVEVLRRLAAEQAIGVTAIKASIDAANVEAATVGMSTGKAAEYTAATNQLNEARRAGRELTPENIAQIQREASALGAAAQNADTMRFAYTNLVQGPMQAFSSAIQQGASAMDALKKAGLSALNALASKLVEMAAQNLWGSAFGGSSGLSSIFGFGGGSPVMSGTGFGAGTGGMSFPMFASGTDSAPGGWSIVGEKGPELMNVPRGAQILPNGKMPGGGGGSTHVTVGVSVDNDGNLQAYVKNVSQQAAVEGVNAFASSPAFVQHVGAASTKARSRRLG